MIPRNLRRKLLEALSSLQLTVFCLGLLFILVLICTLRQSSLGVDAAVSATIRTFLVWWRPEGFTWAIPVFPGGGLIGAVMMLNSLFSPTLRLRDGYRGAGLWLAHAGLALLLVGEYSTAFLQVDAQMSIAEGETKNWSEDRRLKELVFTDVTSPDIDTATIIPASLLSAGASFAPSSLPFTARIIRYHKHASFRSRSNEDLRSEATAGVGVDLAVHIEDSAPPDGRLGSAAALIEIVAEGRPLGVYWTSDALAAPQEFSYDDRRWRLALRRRRYILPFSLTLADFRRDTYSGTSIVSNFASLVRLQDPTQLEDREVLISMNAPLRYGGKTFYQSGFGDGDTLSILQVVRNPGWLIPYLSCALVSLGLLVHLGRRLLASAAVRA